MKKHSSNIQNKQSYLIEYVQKINSFCILFLLWHKIQAQKTKIL